ncbi:MAG: hypothetical protein LBU10_01240 [Endomicrobium sp.]|jgi:hypothetical protein|nr:hypothetical protein [Endomicrobium sp.]
MNIYNLRLFLLTTLLFIFSIFFYGCNVIFNGREGIVYIQDDDLYSLEVSSSVNLDK